MRAMVLEEYNKPLVLRELDTPKPGPDDVLVKMRACSVCNSDNKLRSGLFKQLKLPIIPGHEPAGDVVEVGLNVTEVAVGDRVTFLHYTSCGECKNCLAGKNNTCLTSFKRLGYELNGGFAEYMVAPAANALKVPESVSYQEAALIPDAICTSVHALYDRVIINPGDAVLFMGIGGLGIHGMQVAKDMGAEVFVIDLDERKLALAKELGADHALNPEKVDVEKYCREATNGVGIDVAAEFVGLPQTTESALRSLRIGGTMVMVGYLPGTDFKVDSNFLVMGERTITGSKSRLRHNLDQGLKLVVEKKVKPIIDEIFHFTEVNHVLDKLQGEGFIGRGVLLFD